MSTTTMTPEQRVSKVFEILKTGNKKEHVSGKMTQLDHALRVAQLAMNGDADEETVLAGLTIDIGHLITPSMVNADGDYYIYYQVTDQAGNRSAIDHGRLGADYLRQTGFSNKTSELVESNIMAKRYLLSTGFNFQIGPNDGNIVLASMKLGLLSPTEKHDFEKDPLFKQKVQLAKWNDAAVNTTEVKPPVLDTYRDMAIKNLLMSMKTLY
ncbi:hypothetical protein GGI13_001439 [Coemansia sp. RSA 455]|nr:hypothetical protein GGI14_002954 [Coemansia sp. S680]KAJ2037386.1 hypothetical protein H4S03_003001 [Coemansia sp. S3946]KAJ2044218.1 hypothetical protein H4S04_006338 [Coemansia sp. S16]KAJ2066295.1 hypothetical protein GGI08_001945 [Coemansia sp. S2]KAJ2076186.1 hypothetical protein GGH13_000080 [Coemansia sp. S155-1]KAJ2098309.1 hypothetical protein GGI09_003380 [Coemansia sp. S100]KAJ2106382.1 hypothetical protein GGI16_001952 [Coemansia sp. S142-1]KAJ2117550.1 hypothetical protein I